MTFKKELLDYINILSKTDKKSLSQKTLKAAEELGELAKAVLPYENAHGTTHRVITKQNILEECVDVYLCIKSIVYDLDFSNEDFENMVNHKVKNWANLQAREKDIKYPIPFEIHITVSITNSKTLEQFKTDCIDIGVKPILLDLHLKDGATIKDMMTSSIKMGNNTDAINEMKRISNSLVEKGYEVIREKIETIPWHPAAPSKKHNNFVMPKDCYFESHLNVFCVKDNNIELLNEIAKKHSARKSSNVFKKFDDGSYTIMVTYRDYNTVYEKFVEKLSTIKKEIIENGFQIEKEIVEFSIYDTRINHDTLWINQ